MKKPLPTTAISPITALVGLLLIPGAIQAQGWRLIGITGQQSDDRQDAQNAFIYPDNTLFEISLTNGSVTKLFRTTWVPDSHSIGYNPVDGLLYHTAGANAYRNGADAGHEQGGPDIAWLAFQDNYYMEKINLVTQAMTPVFNANPPPNPDELLPAFGLPAARPTWARPEERRDSTQTDPSFRQRGENEYTGVRGLTWSAAENLFYVTDNEGIFKLTPGGLSTFLARPTFPTSQKNDAAKGIAFVTVTSLLVGHKEGDYMMKLDPQTGEAVGELLLTYPPGGGDPVDEFGGLLGLAQHPVTRVLYGIRQTAEQKARELVTINPVTGATALVGSMGQHIASITFAQSAGPASPWRLIGITGQRDDGETDGQNAYVYPDHTLFEISITTGASTRLFQATFVNDSQAIGYCPVDGLLYHAAGSESYSNDPQRSGHDQGGETISGVGYQDSQYMETINLTTQAMTAIFNAAPCPNPDPLLPCFGLPAARPDWVRPEIQRDSTQTGPEFRERGEHEYHALRGMVWSSTENLFYAADEYGIFKMTRSGNSTFLARPIFPTSQKNDAAKGIAFVTVTRMLVGHKEGDFMMELDPQTGDVVGELPLSYPPGGGDPVDEFGGLLGIAQHPVTGVIYGIRQTAEPLARELVTINPDTGATTLVGSMDMHMAGLAFVPAGTPSPPLTIQAVTIAGNNITITWSGGAAPYQLQTSTTLATGGWTNLGAPTSTTSATVPMNGPLRFYQVQGQ